MNKVAIIGGGASGLTAAIAAAGNGAEAVIYEAMDRVGRSILATGNGRCNFSNSHIDPDLYWNADYASKTLGEFEETYPAGDGPNGVVAFFHNLGMLYREEGEGRLYPLANKASVVLDVLRAKAAASGVEERVESSVSCVEPPRGPGKPFTIRMADGAFERADAVVVACGGKVAQDMLACDIPFAEQSPVLCSLATDTKYVRELDNIRVKAALELRRDGKPLAREVGEAMFRKYGVSGICAFNLSRFAHEGDTLAIDFMPALDCDMTGYLYARSKELEKVYGEALTCSGLLRGMVLPRVADVLLKYSGMAEDAPCITETCDRIAMALKSFELEVLGPGDVEHAQVRRGGFDPHAFDPTTLESHDVPGLHVVGEALDVDGPCGGYNLHWAFATGLLAGRATARG